MPVSAALRKLREDSGVCVRCGLTPPALGTTLCDTCHNKRRAVDKNRQGGRRGFYEYNKDQGDTYRDNRLRKLYGITLADYRTLLAEQNGVCAICKRSPKNPKRNLDVDHDHKTGQVRGLLCPSCNTALGHLKEHPDHFLQSMVYLGLIPTETAQAILRSL